MIQTFHCLFCNYILGKYNLRRLGYLELQCPECGEWNTFEYDPEDYVYKQA